MRRDGRESINCLNRHMPMFQAISNPKHEWIVESDTAEKREEADLCASTDTKELRVQTTRNAGVSGKMIGYYLVSFSSFSQLSSHITQTSNSGQIEVARNADRIPARMA